MSMPTLIVFRDGEPVKRLVGARPKAALREALAEFMEPVA
jgi:thioredoxin 1